MLLLEVLDSLLADNNSLGGFKDFLLDDQRCLPALHPVLLIDEVGSFRPHTTDMFKIVLQVLNNCLLRRLLLFLNALKILAVLKIG